MIKLSVYRFGAAIGLSGAVLYLGCMVLMVLLGKSGTVVVFNSIFHGLNVESILKMNVQFSQSVLGLILTFSLGWIFGVLIAGFYNASSRLR